MDVKRLLLMPGATPGPARRAGPPDPGRVLRGDATLTAVLASAAVLIALFLHNNGSRPTALGWVLLLTAHIPALWRRRAPLPVFLCVFAVTVPYHTMEFNHTAPLPVAGLCLFTVTMTERPRRSLVVGAVVIGLELVVKFSQGVAEGAQALRISGWIVAIILLGLYARIQRQYVDSVIERAERAERTREEEARRRVAEERLRVARDLHDLLAHSITLVGVQTAVAAHVLNATPDRLDRAAVAKALDDIADTCRSARGELRATLEVLRSMPDETRGPLPDLDGLPELVSAARTAGAEVVADLDTADVPPAVGAAAYRIVQEALTNAVRHGGSGLTVRVTVRAAPAGLSVSVVDDGRGAASQPSEAPGFGLIGMRERARSVLGVLEAGPREAGGWEVAATLPFPGAPDARDAQGARDAGDERDGADQQPCGATPAATTTAQPPTEPPPHLTTVRRPSPEEAS
ncbi:sensor histidine kinase [Streptomyces longispororuber]|uniref:sensor histidine kinase n=1 Tax=Streptomyces longispororuber TaxID=68230 RepID=UPI00210F18F8|nr:histidine kinase [Streptomyces longispororuber]MCQ4209381.1 histidine kinase [Streptomyces longispororuber]